MEPASGYSTEPVLLLFGSSSHDDGINPEGDGQKRRRDREIDPSHFFGHAKQIAPSATEPTNFLGQKEQVQTQLRAEHFVDQFDREFPIFVEMQTGVLIESAIGNSLQGLQDETQGFVVETCTCSIHI